MYFPYGIKKNNSMLTVWIIFNLLVSARFLSEVPFWMVQKSSSAGCNGFPQKGPILDTLFCEDTKCKYFISTPVNLYSNTAFWQDSSCCPSIATGARVPRPLWGVGEPPLLHGGSPPLGSWTAGESPPRTADIPGDVSDAMTSHGGMSLCWGHRWVTC